MLSKRRPKALAADEVVSNQKTILAHQDEILKNQKTIIDNQTIIKGNQDKLEEILKNQDKILSLLQK
jgi:hypothetical protein